MSQLRAFITGVTGQDGSYLAEFLSEKGYEVHGFARRGSTPPRGVQQLHYGDLSDDAALRVALHEAQPHEVYNLGAQSHVHASFMEPIYTTKTTALPIVTVLDWVRQHSKSTRVYQASSSEMFGTELPPQDEETRFSPQSPYAIAKVASHLTIGLHRKAYNTFAVAGILFNHESERRPPSFVTRKISLAVARIALGLQDQLVLGNLDAERDWGYAPDYVEAMWLMLQQSEPDDFVIATGEMHTVRDFVVLAFRHAEQVTGKHIDFDNRVRVDDTFKRPAEVPSLRGDYGKARRKLFWQPRVRFQDLVRRMVEHDLNSVARELGKHGVEAGGVRVAV